MKRLLPALLLIAATAGCTSLLESDAPASSTWWLEPADIDLDGISGPETTLALNVSVVPGLDSDRILTLDGDAQLNHFAGAHWADQLPELLTSLVARTLDGAPRFRDVSPRGYAKPDECLLALEVRSFFARLGSDAEAQSVEVSLAGEFHCGDEVHTLSLHAEQAITAHRMPAIVAAFQAATDDVMGQLVGELSGR